MKIIIYFVDVSKMISREKFDYIKEKYGHVGSWAIWAEVGDTPKSNMGDLSILDPDIYKNLLSQLKPNVIFVGLNISRRIERPLANFHGNTLNAPLGNDYKIRFAFRGTPYWGGYMTDIIKDFEHKISGKVISYLRHNKHFEKENIKAFLLELDDIGADNPKLIVFGNDAYNILKRNLNSKFKMIKIRHYSDFINKENYKREVKSILMKKRDVKISDFF
jgi:hypothetical protein